LTTWSDIVCQDRGDLHNGILHTTERLILAHIKWRVFVIADPATIREWVTTSQDEKEGAIYRYSKYLYFPSEMGNKSDYPQPVPPDED